MNSSGDTRRIAAQYVLTPQGLLKQGVVTLSADGTVLSVEAAGNIDSLAYTEFHNGILAPGFVNAHTHLELSYLKGSIDPGCGFPGFAAGLSARRGEFTVGQQAESARYADSGMWAEGIVAAGDISNSDVTFPVKAAGAVLYHTFLEVYGLGRDSADHMQPLLGKARRCAIRTGITPHSTYSLNEDAFVSAVNTTPGGLLSIHFMESRGESDLYAGRGEFARWYAQKSFKTDFTAKYRSPAERIIRNIPSDRQVMLVHNTFVTENDADMLISHFGDNLTWVLCPRSNAYITRAQPPYRMLSAKGARIAVGTDSLASNTSLSLIDELKMFGGVPLAELLRWGTMGGAAALGIGDVYGSLEPGKRPGLVLVEGVDFDTMSLTARSTSKNMLI